MALAPLDKASATCSFTSSRPCGGGKWPDLGRLVEGITDDELGHGLGVALLVLVGDRLVDDEALGRDAALAVVLDPRPYADLDGPLHVGRWHHDERVGAAELEHCLFDDVAGDGGHGLPGAFAPCDGRGRYPVVLQDRLDPVPTDEQGLEDTFWETRTPRRRPRC